MQILRSQKGQSSMIIIGIIVLVAIVGAGLFFMNQKGATITEQPATTDTTTDTSTTSPTGSMDSSMGEHSETTGTEKVIEISGSNFKFAPSTITVNQGDTVKIVFKSTGGFHDFVIDEFDVETKQIGDGQSDEVTFVADKKGKFEFYCSVGNHRKMGMVGTLTVN